MTADRPQTNDAEQFAPGTMGCHEALHMAMVLFETVNERLTEHPAITSNPAWKTRAECAAGELWALYQEIGLAHMEGSANGR